MLVFDKKSLRCVVPPTEECDIPSTTPPPPEEEEEKPRGNPNQARQNQGRTAPRPQVQAAQLRQSASEFQENAASSFVPQQQYYNPQQQEYSEEQQLNYRPTGNREI